MQSSRQADSASRQTQAKPATMSLSNQKEGSRIHMLSELLKDPKVRRPIGSEKRVLAQRRRGGKLSGSRQKQAKPATMSLGGGVGCRTWRHTKAYTISHAFLDVLLNGEKKADHGKPCVFREVLSVCPTGGAEEGERFPQEQKEVAGMPRCRRRRRGGRHATMHTCFLFLQTSSSFFLSTLIVSS